MSETREGHPVDQLQELTLELEQAKQDRAALVEKARNLKMRFSEGGTTHPEDIAESTKLVKDLRRAEDHIIRIESKISVEKSIRDLK